MDIKKDKLLTIRVLAIILAFLRVAASRSFNIKYFCNNAYDYDIANAVKYCCDGSTDYKLIANGTGRYVKHGPVGDCGTTGRKLAVDLYGGNCRISGGSIWTKDGTKADLSLNLLARARALQYIRRNPEFPEVHCAIACKIGSPEILVTLLDAKMQELIAYREIITPDDLIKEFKLDQPRFARMCMEGVFA